MPVIPPGSSGIYQHSTSGTKLIKRALRLLGVLAQGEDVSAGDKSDGLEALNQMLDSWNADKLTIPALVRNSYTLSSGTQEYSIGPSGDLDTARPPKIEPGMAWIVDTTQSSSPEYELEVVDHVLWEAITDKSLTGRPFRIYSDGAYPVANLSLYYMPDAAYTLILQEAVQLAQITNAETALILPPAYAKALSYQLALELAPEYGTVSPEVAATALEAKADVKRLNMRIPLMDFEENLMEGQRENFDIRSDSYLRT